MKSKAQTIQTWEQLWFWWKKIISDDKAVIRTARDTLGQLIVDINNDSNLYYYFMQLERFQQFGCLGSSPIWWIFQSWELLKRSVTLIMIHTLSMNYTCILSVHLLSCKLSSQFIKYQPKRSTLKSDMNFDKSINQI